MNDVRLHVQGRAPGTEWVPERVLARDRRAGEHLPDGVAITEGRRVAIEVELTVKSRERVTAILDELAGRFDAVLYFCAAGPHRQLTELAESGRWPALGVRELPVSLRRRGSAETTMSATGIPERGIFGSGRSRPPQRSVPARGPEPLGW